MFWKETGPAISVLPLRSRPGVTASANNTHTRYANDPNSHHPGSGMLAVIATAFHQPPADHRHFVGQEADSRGAAGGGGGGG